MSDSECLLNRVVRIRLLYNIIVLCCLVFKLNTNRSLITKLWLDPTINSQGVGWQTRFELSLARFKWEYRYHNTLGNTARVGFDITESLQVFYSSQGVLGLTAHF